jgi:hypothetical protein
MSDLVIQKHQTIRLQVVDLIRTKAVITGAITGSSRDTDIAIVCDDEDMNTSRAALDRFKRIFQLVWRGLDSAACPPRLVADGADGAGFRAGVLPIRIDSSCASKYFQTRYECQLHSLQSSDDQKRELLADILE